MTLVAGVDSSTQSCKVVVCDAETGRVLRSGTAAHPAGTEVAPVEWEAALVAAVQAAGGLDDVAAVAVGAQQHGMVCLDGDGAVVRDALLWNDTRSADSATELLGELGDELGGGAGAWARAVGSVPVASFTVTKLRWLATHEPQNAAATAAVCLPHDWLSWRLRGSPGLAALATDRGDASGTGYWSPAANEYRPDLLRLALGSSPQVPAVLAPHELAGTTAAGAPAGIPAGLQVAAGTGDNAAAALGLGAGLGDVIVSLGTSGVVSAVAVAPSADPDGIVAGFADATGHYLPLACTLNGAPALVTTARLLGLSLDELSDAALSAPPGSDGVVLVPYFDGERTPNRPHATAALHGLQSGNATPATVARAAFEGLLCGLADCLDALVAQGVVAERLILVGGATRSAALRAIAPTILALPVYLPEPGEYVALGAARQAAWALGGTPSPPAWPVPEHGPLPGQPGPAVRARYGEVRDLTARRLDTGV